MLICGSKHQDAVESAHSGLDGLILRLVRHPRAADSKAHLLRCATELQEAVRAPEGGSTGLELEEAEQRLRGDDKFAQVWKWLLPGAMGGHGHIAT